MLTSTSFTAAQVEQTAPIPSSTFITQPLPTSSSSPSPDPIEKDLVNPKNQVIVGIERSLDRDFAPLRSPLHNNLTTFITSERRSDTAGKRFGKKSNVLDWRHKNGRRSQVDGVTPSKVNFWYHESKGWIMDHVGGSGTQYKAMNYESSCSGERSGAALVLSEVPCATPATLSLDYTSQRTKLVSPESSPTQSATPVRLTPLLQQASGVVEKEACVSSERPFLRNVDNSVVLVDFTSSSFPPTVSSSSSRPKQVSLFLLVSICILHTSLPYLDLDNNLKSSSRNTAAAFTSLICRFLLLLSYIVIGHVVGYAVGIGRWSGRNSVGGKLRKEPLGGSISTSYPAAHPRSSAPVTLVNSISTQHPPSLAAVLRKRRTTLCGKLVRIESVFSGLNKLEKEVKDEEKNFGEFEEGYGESCEKLEGDNCGRKARTEEGTVLNEGTTLDDKRIAEVGHDRRSTKKEMRRQKEERQAVERSLERSRLREQKLEVAERRKELKESGLVKEYSRLKVELLEVNSVLRRHSIGKKVKRLSNSKKDRPHLATDLSPGKYSHLVNPDLPSHLQHVDTTDSLSSNSLASVQIVFSSFFNFFVGLPRRHCGGHLLRVGIKGWVRIQQVWIPYRQQRSASRARVTLRSTVPRITRSRISRPVRRSRLTTTLYGFPSPSTSRKKKRHQGRLVIGNQLEEIKALNVALTLLEHGGASHHPEGVCRSFPLRPDHPSSVNIESVSQESSVGESRSTFVWIVGAVRNLPRCSVRKVKQQKRCLLDRIQREREDHEARLKKLDFGNANAQASQDRLGTAALSSSSSGTPPSDLNSFASSVSGRDLSLPSSSLISTTPTLECFNRCPASSVTPQLISTPPSLKSLQPNADREKDEDSRCSSQHSDHRDTSTPLRGGGGGGRGGQPSATVQPRRSSRISRSSATSATAAETTSDTSIARSRSTLELQPIDVTSVWSATEPNGNCGFLAVVQSVCRLSIVSNAALYHQAAATLRSVVVQAVIDNIESAVLQAILGMEHEPRYDEVTRTTDWENVYDPVREIDDVIAAFSRNGQWVGQPQLSILASCLLRPIAVYSPRDQDTDGTFDYNTLRRTVFRPVTTLQIDRSPLTDLLRPELLEDPRAPLAIFYNGFNHFSLLSSEAHPSWKNILANVELRTFRCQDFDADLAVSGFFTRQDFHFDSSERWIRQDQEGAAVPDIPSAPSSSRPSLGNVQSFDDSSNVAQRSTSYPSVDLDPSKYLSIEEILASGPSKGYAQQEEPTSEQDFSEFVPIVSYDSDFDSDSHSNSNSSVSEFEEETPAPRGRRSSAKRSSRKNSKSGAKNKKSKSGAKKQKQSRRSRISEPVVENEYWRPNLQSEEEYEATPGHPFSNSADFLSELRSTSPEAARFWPDFLGQQMRTSELPSFPSTNHPEELEQHRQAYFCATGKPAPPELFIERRDVPGATTSEFMNYATLEEDFETATMRIRKSGVGSEIYDGSEFHDLHLHRAANGEGQSGCRYLPSKKFDVEEKLANRFYDIASKVNRSRIQSRAVPPQERFQLLVLYGGHQHREADETYETLPLYAGELGRDVEIVRETLKVSSPDYVKRNKVIKAVEEEVEVVYVKEAGEYISARIDVLHPSAVCHGRVDWLGQAALLDSVWSLIGTILMIVAASRASDSSDSSSIPPSSTPPSASTQLPTLSFISPSSTSPTPTSHNQPLTPPSELSTDTTPTTPTSTESARARRLLVPDADLYNLNGPNLRSDAHGQFASVPSESWLFEFTPFMRISRRAVVNTCGGQGSFNPHHIIQENGFSLYVNSRRAKMYEIAPSIFIDSFAFGARRARDTMLHGEGYVLRDGKPGTGYQQASWKRHDEMARTDIHQTIDGTPCNGWQQGVDKMRHGPGYQRLDGEACSGYEQVVDKMRHGPGYQRLDGSACSGYEQVVDKMRHGEGYALRDGKPGTGYQQASWKRHDEMARTDIHQRIDGTPCNGWEQGNEKMVATKALPISPGSDITIAMIAAHKASKTKRANQDLPEPSERKHKCPRSGCPASFDSRKDLKKHEDSHENNKELCPHCSTRCLARNLGRHLKNHHRYSTTDLDRFYEKTQEAKWLKWKELFTNHPDDPRVTAITCYATSEEWLEEIGYHKAKGVCDAMGAYVEGKNGHLTKEEFIRWMAEYPFALINASRTTNPPVQKRSRFSTPAAVSERRAPPPVALSSSLTSKSSVRATSRRRRPSRKLLEAGDWTGQEIEEAAKGETPGSDQELESNRGSDGSDEEFEFDGGSDVSDGGYSNSLFNVYNAKSTFPNSRQAFESPPSFQDSSSTITESTDPTSHSSTDSTIPPQSTQSSPSESSSLVTPDSGIRRSIEFGDQLLAWSQLPPLPEDEDEDNLDFPLGEPDEPPTQEAPEGEDLGGFCDDFREEVDSSDSLINVDLLVSPAQVTSPSTRKRKAEEEIDESSRKKRKLSNGDGGVDAALGMLNESNEPTIDPASVKIPKAQLALSSTSEDLVSPQVSAADVPQVEVDSDGDAVMALRMASSTNVGEDSFTSELVNDSAPVTPPSESDLLPPDSTSSPIPAVFSSSNSSTSSSPLPVPAPTSSLTTARRSLLRAQRPCEIASGGGSNHSEEEEEQDEVMLVERRSAGGRVRVGVKGQNDECATLETPPLPIQPDVAAIQQQVATVAPSGLGIVAGGSVRQKRASAFKNIKRSKKKQV